MAGPKLASMLVAATTSFIGASVTVGTQPAVVAASPLRAPAVIQPGVFAGPHRNQLPVNNEIVDFGP